MDITPLIPKGRNIINSYNETGFKISEKDFLGSVILLPIEILLIGTGKKHLQLKQNFRGKIKAKFFNISIDEMATSAACRTFNILTLEDRKVAAILIV